MKKLAVLALTVALLAVAAGPGLAWAGGSFHGRGGFHGHSGHHRFAGHHFHSRVFIGFGPSFVYPYYYYPPPYYYYPPPPVVVQEPPVYVQPPAPAPAQPEAYWYYCEGAKAYYPNVQTCAEAWIKVPPRAQ